MMTDDAVYQGPSQEAIRYWQEAGPEGIEQLEAELARLRAECERLRAALGKITATDVRQRGRYLTGQSRGKEIYLLYTQQEMAKIAAAALKEPSCP